MSATFNSGLRVRGCRHRRPRRLLATLFATALMLTTFGSGLLRGTAIGHADATRHATITETCQPTR